MKKLQVGDKVKVVGTHKTLWGERGIVVAVVKEDRRKEYIVQFCKPSTWSFFSREELKIVE